MTDSTRLPGVYPTKKKDGTEYYRASLTYKSKHISLGSYDTMEKAHHAYLEAMDILRSETLDSLKTLPTPGDIVTIEDYDTSTHVLLFEKWVSLINLRDNHIYFANPIYVHKNFFEYYVAPDYIFKFDLDDLFYYSSHKIMRRNGHLFVADYGMQYNIMNRYGIKNYAVLGRDYEFINGDSFDMRYENIRILNTYHGVTFKRLGDKIEYRAQIHIRGNYIIGTFPTPEEAAIAYNKAIDVVKKNGLDKNYVPNYIESLPARQYADIYSRIEIPEKIKQYHPL